MRSDDEAADRARAAFTERFRAIGSTKPSL